MTNIKPSISIDPGGDHHMQESDFTQWLLNAQTPSIRYLTLTGLLGYPDRDTRVRTAKREMKSDGPLPAILKKQTRIGSWPGEQSYYTPKYTSTHWTMVLLAELATDRRNASMRRGAIYMLGETWERLQERLETKEHGFTCFWANMMRYALHSRLDDDPRLRGILEAIVHDATNAEWRCEYNDERPCAWGAARALWGLAALPDHLKAHEEVIDSIQSGLKFLLEDHNLRKANYPKPKKGKTHPMWFRLNFPLFYQADTLFVLRTLNELNVLDHHGAGDAIEWLIERRNKNGRWRGASPFRQRTWKEIGDRKETDRWVSLHAAIVLEGLERKG